MDTEEAKPSTSQETTGDLDDHSDKASQKSNNNSDIDKREHDFVSRTQSSENSAVDGDMEMKASDSHAKKETKSGHRHQVRRGRIDKRARARHATGPMRRSQRLIEKNENIASRRESEEIINKENQPEEPHSNETSRTPSENSGDVRVKVERVKTHGRARRQKRQKPGQRRRRGRIEKRTRQRQPGQRGRRMNRSDTNDKAVRNRENSQDSVSSLGSLALHGCALCGHRCCSRRYKTEARSWYMKRRSRRAKGIDVEDVVMSSRRVQVGSRCAMLSPLCVNATMPEPRNRREQLNACEITPEMIFEAMQRLTMWRMEVTTADILNDIKRYYPVGNGDSLMAELREKLRIAAIIGIVERKGGRWLMCGSLNSNQWKLPKSHVTWFWELYHNSMRSSAKESSDGVDAAAHPLVYFVLLVAFYDILRRKPPQQLATSYAGS